MAVGNVIVGPAVSVISGGGGYSVIEDEGTPLTARSTINFVGTGVTAADSGGKTVVTISSGGAGTPATSVVDESSFGASSAVGVSTNYAREDHTHGTPSLGTTATTACAGNDSRLSNARTPTAHATSHKSGGSDVINLDELGPPSDVLTLNVSTSAHGLFPKLPNTGGTTFFNDAGVWATPTASAADANPNLYVTIANYNLASNYSIAYVDEYEIGSGFVTDIAENAILGIV